MSKYICTINRELLQPKVNEIHFINERIITHPSHENRHKNLKLASTDSDSKLKIVSQKIKITFRCRSFSVEY